MKTILLIEDDELTRSMMGQLLRLDGFDVILAEDGQAGITILESRVPDLVLLDLMLPHMDGAAFLGALRSSLLADLPVIVASAVSDGPLLQLAREIGIQGEFFKARTSIDSLLTCIHTLLSPRAATRPTIAAAA